MNRIRVSLFIRKPNREQLSTCALFVVRFANMLTARIVRYRLPRIRPSFYYTHQLNLELRFNNYTTLCINFTSHTFAHISFMFYRINLITTKSMHTFAL